MGTVPDRHPIYMSEISGELAGENNLGYYRGRQYWKNKQPVTISQSPAMSEFPGLTNVAPVANLNQPMYTFWVDAPSPNAFIQIRWWPTSGSGVVHGSNGVNLYALDWATPYNPALYYNFNYSYIINSGCCLSGFTILDGDPYNVLHQYDFPQGSSINITAWVTATAY